MPLTSQCLPVNYNPHIIPAGNPAMPPRPLIDKPHYGSYRPAVETPVLSAKPVRNGLFSAESHFIHWPSSLRASHSGSRPK